MTGVDGFVLGEWDVAELGVQAGVVEPVDPNSSTTCPMNWEPGTEHWAPVAEQLMREADGRVRGLVAQFDVLGSDEKLSDMGDRVGLGTRSACSSATEARRRPRAPSVGPDRPKVRSDVPDDDLSAA